MSNCPFLLSSVPAKWIDNLILYSPKMGFAQPAKQIGARALSLTISVTVFPLFLAVDLTFYTIKSIADYAWSLTLPADSQPEATSMKSHEVAMKCLRGLTASPAGIVWRDIVSNHFLPKVSTEGEIHPTGGLYSSKASQHYPETIEEIQNLVQQANNDNRKISIRGAGYSQGKQVLPPNDSDLNISLNKLNSISIDKESKTVTVGAGATWSMIQNAADQEGLAVKVMQASNVFSVGGSLGANCHGWDHTEGSLANTIKSITVVNAQGEIKKLTPEDELFRLVIGGYGMFGIIVEAEIELADNEDLFDFAEKIAPKDYYQHFTDNIETNPNLKMHLYRLSLEHGKLLQSGWAQSYSSSCNQHVSNNLTDETQEGTVMDRILLQIARSSPLARTLWWQQEEKNLQTIKKATRNEIMRPKINAVFMNKSSAHKEWLQEYFVPGEKLGEFLEFLSTVLNENDVALLNASVRFVKQDTNAEMGYAKKGDRFAIVLFFNQSLNADEVNKTKSWIQKVVNKLTEIDGTFYLPYMHFATQEQFKKCYPQWEQIKNKKEEYDSECRFDNGLFQDYFQ